MDAEWVDQQEYVTPAVAHASLAEYIDGFYNPTRRHSHLDYVSPMAFELKAHVAAIAA